MSKSTKQNGPEDKKVTNNRYKHRGSAAVELLRKQVQLEKSRSGEHPNYSIPGQCLELAASQLSNQDAQLATTGGNVFQDLIADLKSTGNVLQI